MGAHGGRIRVNSGLGAARGQFEDLLRRAQAGDPTAMMQLQGSSDAYLRIARELFASSGAYVDIFNQVVGSLTGVSGYDANWQARLTSSLPVSSTIASAADLDRLGARIIQALGGVAAANDEAVEQQTVSLRSAQPAEAARR